MGNEWSYYKQKLIESADAEYKAFNDPIVNCEYPTLGVRTPVIKKLASSVALADRDDVLDGFFADGEPTYDTVLFAGCLAAKKGDYEKTRCHLARIIPLFRSWAHVDCVVPCLRWVDKDGFLNDFSYLLDRDGQYETRTYIIFLFECLTDERVEFVLETLKTVRYGRYYVDMAAAWLLAECLVKFYDKTLKLFEAPVFPVFVHNKAIQKARESFRISPDVKAYLNTLKIKRS